MIFCERLKMTDYRIDEKKSCRFFHHTYVSICAHFNQNVQGTGYTFLIKYDLHV